MCGRYATMGRWDIQLEFRLDVVADSYAPSPSWNVAPTQDVPIIVERRPLPGDEWLDDAVAQPTSTPPGTPAPTAGPAPDVVRALTPAFWGLIPPWAKNASRPMINARMETLAEKPSFATALRKRRCIFPAAGYFEWRKPDRTPFYIYRDNAPLALAGLYGWFKDGEDWLLTATIVTRAARGELAQIHDRTPLILNPDEYDMWLDPTLQDPTLLEALSRPGPRLSFHEVGRAVGNVSNNSPDNIAAVSGTPQV